MLLSLAATTETLQSEAVLASHWKLDEGNGTSTSASTVSHSAASPQFTR